MEKHLNKKGFTLVELLAVIVVLAIVMALAVISISNVINDARKNTFVTDALSFLDGAHQLVSSDSVSNLLGGDGSGSYAPNCGGSSSDTKYIPLLAINLEKGGVKSPWGNKYVKGETTTEGKGNGSFVMVSSVIGTQGGCTYKYSIYLTDGVHSIGTSDSPIEEGQVNTSKITVK